ncbi:MAG: hypothetical protein O7F76_05790 [Planctomycetota bacterium]|nr:hypothetical protein [Planctomycetota bacterium]
MNPLPALPSGYEDNYVDTPVPADADVKQGKAALDEVGRMMNERLEAVKQRPLFKRNAATRCGAISPPSDP